MKIIKKILRIIAILLPCYCFAAAPGVSAKSYSVDQIPFSVPAELHSPEFYMEWDRPLPISSPDLFYYSAYLDNDQCIYSSYSNAKSLGIPTGTRLSYYLPYYLNGNKCQRLGQIDISPLSLPPYAVGIPNFRDWDSYRYQYSGIFMNDSNTNDGLNAQTKIDLTHLFSPVPDSWLAFNWPLGMPLGSVEPIEVNTPIYIDGQFWLDSVNGSFTDFSFTPGVFQVRYDGFVSESDFNNLHKTTFTFPCSYDVSDDNGIKFIDFVCSYHSPVSFYNNLYSVSLQLQSGNNNTLLSYSDEPRLFVIDHITIVYNNDNSPSGSFSGVVNGGEPQNAPGSILNPSYHKVDTDSWEYKLSHIFDFSFLNPFSSVFGFFQAPDHCVSIPHLASWLHVSNSQVCPLYPSPVYMLLTPVFGAIPIMVIFSYAIKWLRDDESIYVSFKGGKA